ncbi:MAG: MFS transporter, partial [Nostocoides sp.]
LWVALPMVAIFGTTMVVLPRASTLVGVGAVALIASVGNGLGSGIVMTLGADAAPSEGRAQFLGGWRFLSVAGGSVAPVLVGVVAAAASLAAASVSLGVIAWVGGVWLARFLRVHDAARGRSVPDSA